MLLRYEITRRKVQIIPPSRVHYRLPEGLPSTVVDRSDVRQPDLEQVDFWLPADDGYNSYSSPMPKDPQRYPANLVD